MNLEVIQDDMAVTHCIHRTRAGKRGEVVGWRRLVSTLRFSLVGLLVLAVASVAPGCSCRDRPARPNVIYILADDLGYAELGSYGQTKIRTPHLDQLAREGMRFTQHYSGSPVCAPSRATLLTGLHTGHAQVRDNYELGGFPDEEERGQLPLKPGTVTLGTLLQEHGYATAIIGKWGLGGPGSTGVPNNQGFDFFYGYLDQKQAHNYYPTHLWRNTEWDTLRQEYFHPHQRIEEEPDDSAGYDRYKGIDYAPDLMTEEAIRFIQTHRDDPFFLYLAYPIPHVALQAPDESLEPYDFEETPYLGERGYLPHPRPRAAYAGMVSRMDDYVGRLIELLRELELDSKTLVMFSSDNGPTFNGGTDSDFFESAGPLRGLKTEVYEGGIRVPMIAWWPGRIDGASTTDHVSAFWDVLPTVAEATGFEAPTGLDGLSFLPTLLGREDLQEHHDHLYWEFHGRWGGAQAVRLGRWKAVRLGGHENPDARIELYDLASDIGERHDVATDHPEVVDRARQIMESRSPSEIAEWNFASSQ
jgi:arylsulfatase A-like enzyme